MSMFDDTAVIRRAVERANPRGADAVWAAALVASLEPRRPARRQLRFVAAAAVAVLIAVVVVINTYGRDTTAPVNVTTGVRFALPDPLPSGWTVTDVTSSFATKNSPPNVWVFRRGTAALVLSRPTSDNPGFLGVLPELETRVVDVNGLPGVLAPARMNLWHAALVRVTTPTGEVLRVATRGIDDAETERLARDVVSSVLAGSVSTPPGFTLEYDGPDRSLLAASQTDQAMTFRTEGGAEVTLTIFDDSPYDPRAEAWIYDDVSFVTVNGAPGLAGTDPEGADSVVSWALGDARATLVGNISKSSMVDVANSVRAVSEATWKDLARTAPTGSGQVPVVTVSG
jgi:hypothetical protein